MRKSAERDYRQHWGYLREVLGWRDIRSLTPLDIKTLRGQLIDTGLKVKTVKNIVAGTFRAILRDAQVDGVIARNPFEDLPRAGFWPRVEVPGPDPFTEEERKRIIAWYHKNSRQFWPFVAFQMHQSLRPSEATALTWDKIDLNYGTCHVTQSRHLGATNATKTGRARRVAHLKPLIVEILRVIAPLHAAPGVYVFTNTTGGPIQMETFKALWNRSLKSQKCNRCTVDFEKSGGFRGAFVDSKHGADS